LRFENALQKDGERGLVLWSGTYLHCIVVVDFNFSLKASLISLKVLDYFEALFISLLDLHCHRGE